MKKISVIIALVFSGQLGLAGENKCGGSDVKEIVMKAMNGRQESKFEIRDESFQFVQTEPLCNSKQCNYLFIGTDIKNEKRDYNKLFSGHVACDPLTGASRLENGYYAIRGQKHEIYFGPNPTPCAGKENSAIEAFIDDATRNLNGFDPYAKVTKSDVYSLTYDGSGVYVGDDLALDGFVYIPYRNGALYYIFGHVKCNSATGEYVLDDDIAGHSLMAWELDKN
ncbi:MAG: hypothetical protein A4S09_13955 [Proteobacteria bacterium SG_bin7]|nr:MAG: hypothetical protein A4S09_13955 [Proteobacteria bacterium SG_bin7]